MINPLLSVAAGVVATLLFGLLFGKVAYGILPGIIVMGVTFWLLGRRVIRDVQNRMETVRVMLTPKNPMKPTKPRIDDAVGVLKGALAWRRWQPLIAPQIEGQIGVLYFLDKRFDEAQPYLDRTTGRNWVGKAMLGVIYYRRKKPAEMRAAFESALKYSGKESLLWNTYAWCLYKRQERDAAIDVLLRAKDKLGDEARTAKNLQAIQNNKGMKMKGWNEMWYQFHLEKPPQVQALPQKQFGKRALYRGR